MALIIKDQRIVDDNWLLIKPAQDGAIPAMPDNADVIVPLDFWLTKKDELSRRQGRVGVWLDAHQEPQLLAQDLPSLPLVAVNFPQFADGRGFSIGRLLRERYRYQGELRAVGDVLRDQMLYMHRCGFNAFAVRADKNIEDALSAFKDFSDAYQASVDRPLPLFRRRLN